jgi:hypothetical protein
MDDDGDSEQFPEMSVEAQRAELRRRLEGP